MPGRLYDYDPAEALDSAEAIAVFLADSQEAGDPMHIAQVEAVAARARQRLGIAPEPHQNAHLDASK